MKRLFALWLSLILLLSACGGTQVQTTSDGNMMLEDTPEKIETPFDAAPGEPDYPLVSESTELRLVFPIQGDDLSVGMETLVSAFEEATGITLSLNPLPATEYLMDFNTMIASGELPDLIMSAPAYMLDPELSDGLMPLNDLIAEYAPNYIRAANNCYDGVLPLIEESGEIMQLYQFYDEPRSTPGIGTVIRADWLEELEMEPPETYEDYHQILTAMKNKYEPELPFRMLPAGITDGDNFTAGFGVSLGSRSAFNGFYQQDGVVKYGMLENGFTEYVTMMRQWFEEGLITLAYTDSADLYSNSYLIDLSMGESGVFFVSASAYKTLEGMCEFPITPGMDPVQNTGDISHLASQRATSIYGTGLSISSFCPNPELAVQAADWFYSEEAVQLGNYGIAGKPNSTEKGTPEFSEMSLEEILWYTTDMQGVILNTRIERILEGYGYDEIFSVWNQQKDTAYMLPDVFFDEDEVDRYQDIMLDVGTYADGCVAELIRGELPISEIPNVQAKLKEMGIEEIIDMLQNALDRYR